MARARALRPNGDDALSVGIDVGVEDLTFDNHFRYAGANRTEDLEDAQCLASGKSHCAAGILAAWPENRVLTSQV